MQSMVSMGDWKPNERSDIKKEPGKQQNMEQNADPWIINIYIYSQLRRIGF